MPCVNGKSLTAYAVFGNGLTKREIRFAHVRSQFDESSGAESDDQITREGNMARPVTNAVGPVTARLKCQRGKLSRERKRLQFRDESTMFGQTLITYRASVY